MTNDISVIIPTANNHTDLAVLLVQLQSQVVLAKQIILIDNSPDQYAQKLARRYGFNTPIIVSPWTKERNIYESWNEGMKYVQGDNVVILNDDMLIPDNLISEFKIGFEKNYECLMPFNSGFPPVRHVRPEYVWRRDGSVAGYDTNRKKVLDYIPLLTGFCFGLSTELIEKVGYFDEQFEAWYGDTDYSMRITGAGYDHVAVTNMIISHYGTSSYSKVKPTEFTRMNHDDQVKYELKYNLPHQNLGWDDDAQES